MRALLRVLRSGWFISLIGLLLIALLIWYAGPLFAFADWQPWASEDARLLTIVGVVLLWALYRLFGYIRAKAVSSRVIEAILGRHDAGTSEAPQPADQEVAVLEQNLKQAVEVLKAGKTSRLPGRQFLYQLPWYVLIGPPGSGKTTALTSSRLRFLVTKQDGQGRELRGVHGTRDCDWFFTDQAVLLDTAGRYVTQDSREEVDRGAWLGFLKLLKTYRKRRPINGVLVCVSLPDLATQSEAQTQQQSQAIRLRIRELHEQLGIRFPIYFLFTKCDLLAGFSEFFDDLNGEDRQQVWGMTFPLETDNGDYAAVFGEEYCVLEKALDERLGARLEGERDPQRRAMLYSFPQQFASVKIAAERFIQETFEPTRYELPATLRGVYFTSGTQVGTPLDRLTAALTASFALSRQQLPAFSGAGRSYFVSRLLTDLVFPEAGLANSDPIEEKRRQWLQRGVLAGAVLAVALVALAWVNSYFRNHALLEEVSAQAARTSELVTAVDGDEKRLVATLTALDGALQLTGRHRDGDSLFSAVTQIGLDQRPGLETEADNRYRAVLRELLLPRLVLRLEERLRAATQTDEIYAALRTYLMLRTPKHFSVEQVAEWLAQDLQTHDLDRVSKPERERLIVHLGNLFDRGPVKLPLDLDANVVQLARGKLLGMSLADRIYAQIIDSHSLWRELPDFHPSGKVGSVFNYVFAVTPGRSTPEGGVDRRFTIAGYALFRQQISATTDKLAGESWIVGEGFGGSADRDLGAVRAQVLRRYLEDYQARWDAFLESITLAPFDNDINKAIDVLQILSADESPLKKLMIAVERETTLRRADDLAAKGSDAARGALRSLGDRLGGLLETPRPSLPNVDDTANLYPVDTHFGRLNDLIRAADGSPPGIDGSLGLLTELAAYLKSLQSIRGIKLVDEVKGLSRGVVGRLQQTALRQPGPLRRWMEVADWQVRQILGARALDELNAEWRATVYRDYQRGLRGRYPMARNSNRDATLADFGDFFGPDGSMDRFFRDYLADLVDTSGRVWRVPENSPIHISRDALTAMQRAAVIRGAFFTSRDKMPVVRFTLQPITMDASINAFSLDLDGQTLSFDHSATRKKAVQWPGPRATGAVRLRVSPPARDGGGGKTIEGTWAWFRLLDGSRVARRAADEYLITFDLSGRKVEYLLQSGSTLNPFKLSELGRFQCPEVL